VQRRLGEGFRIRAGFANNILDHSARQRVLATIEREAEPEQAAFDYAAWWAEVDALQAAIRSRIGESGTVGVLSHL